jgi:hypothetical protein
MLHAQDRGWIPYRPESHRISQPTMDKALPTNLGRIHHPLRGLVAQHRFVVAM